MPYAFSFMHWIYVQWKWSKKTFGAGRRTKGIIAHMRKELEEVEQNPDDLIEWVDLVMLSLDGYWRHGGTFATLVRDLERKQKINKRRVYPFPQSEDVPSEHVR